MKIKNNHLMKREINFKCMLIIIRFLKMLKINFCKMIFGMSLNQNNLIKIKHKRTKIILHKLNNIRIIQTNSVIIIKIIIIIIIINNNNKIML